MNLVEKSQQSLLHWSQKVLCVKRLDKKLEDNGKKGTKKSVVAEDLFFEDCKTYMFDGLTIYGEQILLKSKKHQVFTVNKLKIAYVLEKITFLSSNRENLSSYYWVYFLVFKGCEAFLNVFLVFKKHAIASLSYP